MLTRLRKLEKGESKLHPLEEIFHEIKDDPAFSCYWYISRNIYSGSKK